VVIEGNRRLTALFGLGKKEFRDQMFQKDEWEKLSKESVFDTESAIPAILVEDRTKVSSILGRRHIEGILTWQPLAQARFIAKLVDDENLSFAQVADQVGKTKSDVSNMYRNQAIAKQAEENGFSGNAFENSFSLVTVAMTAPGIRSFISAPLGNEIEPRKNPIPDSHIPEMKELLSWIFGDSNNDKGPVIQESRNIPKLGKIISSPVGLDTLRKTWSLEEAEAAMKEKGMDPYARLMARLKTANESLKSAFDDINDYTDDEVVKTYVSSIMENSASLSEIVDD
jgi:hypothetical protein